MTGDDFKERSRLRLNGLLSPIVLGGHTIGYVPSVPAEDKQFKAVSELLRLFDKMRWCVMLGVDCPPWMGMHLVAIEVQIAVLDKDLESVDWFRAILGLPSYPNPTKLPRSENFKDFSFTVELFMRLLDSKWRGAKHGKEFAYLATATRNSVKRLVNKTKGEYIAASKGGCTLVPMDKPSPTGDPYAALIPDLQAIGWAEIHATADVDLACKREGLAPETSRLARGRYDRVSESDAPEILGLSEPELLTAKRELQIAMPGLQSRLAPYLAASRRGRRPGRKLVKDI